MLVVTASSIAWHAIDLLLGLLTHEHVHNHGGGHHHGIDMEHPGLALSMTIVSISVKEGLYWITKRAGERQGSGLMKANAWHHSADAISSVVALIGVGGTIIGVKFLDPLAGFVVLAMILKAGLETGYQSVLELVDAAIPLDQFDPIKQTILQVKGIKIRHICFLAGGLNMTRKLKNKDIKRFVHNVLKAEFAEKMEVDRVVEHLLQGKILL